MSSVNGLNYDQPYINVVKFDTNMYQQIEIETECDRKLISEFFIIFYPINHTNKDNLFIKNCD